MAARNRIGLEELRWVKMSVVGLSLIHRLATGRSFAVVWMSQVDPISRGQWWIAAPGGEAAINFEEFEVGCGILCPGSDSLRNVEILR